MGVNATAKSRAIIANLPSGISVSKWNKGDATYIRVRLGKKFTGGKPHTRCVKTEKAARQFIFGDAEQFKKPTIGVIDLKRQSGAAAFELSSAEIAEAAAAIKNCRKKGFSLTEIVDFGLRHKKPPGGVKTFREVADAVLTRKQTDEKSPKHISNMAGIYQRFSTEFGKKPINLITQSMIEEWQCEQDDVSQVRRVAYARNLHILFEYAIEREWLEKNPCKSLERSTKKTGVVEFLSIPQLARLMKCAMEKYPNLVPGLAIKAFGGVRTGELLGLTWDKVGTKKIEILAKTSKSRRTRGIEQSDNLIAWLNTCRKSKGSIAEDDSTSWYNDMEYLASSAGIKVPYNGLRHGYGTFRYNLDKNENLTAYQMGNSPKVVLDWYVSKIVEDEDIKDFWAMTPEWIRSKPPEYFVEEKRT
jgi:integrase